MQFSFYVANFFIVIVNNMFSFLQQLLTLVFVETKRAADSLERWLSKNGFPATSIHGDKTQPVS